MNNNNEENKNDKIFYPSLKVEKKTQAFNKYIWWFVVTLSMFTVGIGVMAFHTFLCSFLNIVDSFLLKYFLLSWIPVIGCVLLSYQLLQILTSLMTSYKFENGKIIKGRIKNVNKVKGRDLALDSALLINMIRDIDNVTASTTASNLNLIAELIDLNCNREFVQNYFDTDLYKKKTYENPRLIKTTIYSLIYICDKNKKLVIPKIYVGLCQEENKNESSFLLRVLKRSAIVFAIALIIAIIDLSVSYSKNNNYIDNILNVESSIEQELDLYGYTVYEINKKVYEFKKEVGDGERGAEIKYYFDKTGAIKDVDVQLYYDDSCENIEDELRYIISTINYEFNSDEIEDFIETVMKNVEGDKYIYAKLTSGDYKLTLGSSGGYVDIHSY